MSRIMEIIYLITLPIILNTFFGEKFNQGMLNICTNFFTAFYNN